MLEIKEQIYQKHFLKIDFKTFNRRFFFSFCEMRESLGRGILEILQMKNKTHNIPVLYSGFDLLKRFASPPSPLEKNQDLRLNDAHMLINIILHHDFLSVHL